MAVEGLEALAADLLEDDDLVSLHGIIEHCSLDYRSLNIRSSDLHLRIVCNEKHLGELHISTLGIGKPMHKDFISSFNLELLACNFNYCVHLKLLFKVPTASVRL